MKQKTKKCFSSIFQRNIGKQVFLSYQKDGKLREDLLWVIRIDDAGVVVLNKDERTTKILNEDIKSVSRKNIDLLSIKFFLGKANRTRNPAKAYFIDKSVTEIIHILKEEEEYHLQTRSAIFSKNGGFSKLKQSAYELEIATYKWLDTKEKLILCPIAILNQKKLIAIDRDGQFVIIDQKGKSSTLLCRQDFVVQTNEKISSINSQSLSYLAEKLL